MSLSVLTRECFYLGGPQFESVLEHQQFFFRFFVISLSLILREWVEIALCKFVE
jgi:hypothetical protein